MKRHRHLRTTTLRSIVQMLLAHVEAIGSREVLITTGVNTESEDEAVIPEDTAA